MNIFRRGLLACYVVSTACVPAWAEDVSAVVGKGWTLLWSDEFDNPEIDSSKWDWETNCWGGGNNELQCYTDRSDNSFIRDGNLVIRAQKNTSPAPQSRWNGKAMRVRKAYPIPRHGLELWARQIGNTVGLRFAQNCLPDREFGQLSGCCPRITFMAAGLPAVRLTSWRRSTFPKTTR